jgi:ABC-type Mn2+/Zn2+ transport system permease subunit
MTAMHEIFEAQFMRLAAIGGSAAALALGVLGVYVVLRRVVFVGLALANIATLGAALAVVIGVAPELSALAAALAGAAGLALAAVPRRVPAESLVGWGYAAAAAVTVLVLARSAPGTTEIMSLVFGTVLTVSPGMVGVLVALAVGVLAVHALFGKRFLLVVFDEDTARAAGVRTTLWTLALYLVVGLATAAALRATGTLLAFALVTLPAMGALLVTRGLTACFVVSAAIAVAVVPAGLVLSYVWDLPTGPLTVGLLAACVAAAHVIGRWRG